MNTEEVMTLVKRIHDYSCYNSILTVLLILFLIITICSAFLLAFLQYEESSEEDTKADRIIAFISMLSVMFFAFGLLAKKHLKKTIHYQQMVLAKKVITNKSETWMDWNIMITVIKMIVTLFILFPVHPSFTLIGDYFFC